MTYSKNNLQQIFQQPFNQEEWQQMLQHYFHATELRKPERIDGMSEEEKGYYLGVLDTTDSYRIGLFYYQILHGNVARKRVGLRNLVHQFIHHTKGEFDAALVVFDSGSVWRLSFVCDIKGEDTAPKRYTYVFGENDNYYNTPVGRFDALQHKGISFENIKDAFSVERLNKDFFNGYKERYGKFLKYINDDTKENRDYVKKLLGRLVFLQFLQKKGWMGVPVNQQGWNGGNKFYLNHLIESYEGNDRLLSDVLEPLFFNTLNERRANDLADSRLGENIKIPYLNGGLFDKDELEKKDIDFPYDYFKELMDFFAMYNFTIDENDPEDSEIGIDPEMLGHIFENLLEDNKDKGAFYTPKEIVQYMSQESITQYLKTHTEEALHAAIEGLIKERKVDEALQNKVSASKVYDLLCDVKVCDPAIGSGAFPMGVLNVLYHSRQVLYGFTKSVEAFSPAAVKREIIQNNIYGVDIEKGAVDIARLRFWLALVVDEIQPEPLPNLDFKIMQGNSLLEQYCGVDLSNILQSDDMFVRAAAADLPEKLKQYYLTNSHNEKMELRAEITEIVENCIREANSSAPSIKVDGNNQFFLWHTWFKDVFDKGGFDIVIGNPPYVQLQTNSGQLAKMYEKCGYKTFASTSDIYCLFYERGHQLLKQGGHLCYITSNKWMRAGYGEKTRDFFAMQTNPMLLIDFAGVKIFESATVDTNILLFAKDTNQHQTICAVTNKQNKDSVKNLSDFVRLNGSMCTFNGSDSWVILTPIEQSIKHKIESVGTPLRDWDINIYRGVLTGYNEAFIISTEKRDEILAKCKSEDERTRTAELIRPILRGRDIKRYGYDWANLWLIYVPWHFPLHKDPSIQGASSKAEQAFSEQYPAVYQHLLQYKQQLSARNKAETGIRYEWYAMQRWGANYSDDFFKPKIVWASVGETSYSLVPKEYLLLDTNYFFAIDNPSELLAILNSKLITWWINSEDTQLGNGGAWRHYKYNLEKLHIPQNTNVFKEFIKNILHNISVKESILSIDRKVYALYNLTEQEIAFIENREP